MNKRRFLILCLLGLLPLTLQAASKQTGTLSADDREQKDHHRFPTGCTPVGFKQDLKVLTLYPGKEGALQSMFFFYNELPQTVNLYQMNDKSSAYSTRFNHAIRAGSWAVLATGEPLVKFTCTVGGDKTTYGNIVDCAQSIKVCEYVHVKFGLNNKGNFWIVESNTRNGAVSEVVHYGIIPGV